MSEFNFKSQICTTREQSERLLSLGLKKDTADMVHYKSASMKEWGVLATPFTKECEASKCYYPAWSLHRLLSLLPECVYHKNKACFLYLHLGVFCEWRSTIWDWEANDKAVEIFDKPDLWENLIDCIEWLIKEGYFNKEYLCQK